MCLAVNSEYSVMPAEMSTHGLAKKHTTHQHLRQSERIRFAIARDKPLLFPQFLQY